MYFTESGKQMYIISLRCKDQFEDKVKLLKRQSYRDERYVLRHEMLEVWRNISSWEPSVTEYF